MARKLICPNVDCGKSINHKADWTCPWCGELNGVERHPNIIGKLLALPFINPGRSCFEPCVKCRKLAAYGLCPYCRSKVLINESGDKTKTINVSKGFYEEVGEVYGKLLETKYEAVMSQYEAVKSQREGEMEKERLMRELEREELLAKIRKVKGAREEGEEEAERLHKEKLKKMQAEIRRKAEEIFTKNRAKTERIKEYKQYIERLIKEILKGREYEDCSLEEQEEIDMLNTEFVNAKNQF